MHGRVSGEDKYNESNLGIAKESDQDTFPQFEASLLMTGLGFGEHVFGRVHEWNRVVDRGTLPGRAFTVGRRKQRWRINILEEGVQTWWRGRRSNQEAKIPIELAPQQIRQANPADANEAICALFHGSGRPRAAPLTAAALKEIGSKLSLESDKALGSCGR
ncbi:uncharacterized protein Z520_02190 [Fonsecaea multimorphosa CBS 102226]|uniref:Uncharacterized protein n=1 Tax=Fonsecaea multimorphosa CBS 102226 TaxID=1442371 RepID=A0A0D2IYC1_9EURO|nr:uncharacterized protein Z520_02190 [Fonsecaea multimorphosa CBS 102226]KIY02052.1 hypothetical protein Z520_02190 [Fonsecaea multimorphosa CBS 102226]